jgi:hypothetical protein
MNLDHPLMPFALVFIGIPIIGLLTAVACLVADAL